MKAELEKLARHRLGRAKEAQGIRAEVSAFIEECERVLERLIAEEE